MSTALHILTGATGALGAHILHQLCNARKGIKKVVCLCRANSNGHARVRVEESLRTRQLLPLEGSGTEVITYAAQLGKPDLGLGAAVYEELKGEVTAIIHVSVLP